MRFLFCFWVCFTQILFLGTCNGANSTTYSYLQTDAEIESYDGFTFTGASGSSLYYNCSGVTYLGGFDNTGIGSTIQRAFSDLPLHNQIQVSFDFIFGNIWDIGDKGYLYADGKQIWSDAGYSTQSNYNTSLDCGNADFLLSNPFNAGDYEVAEYTPSPSVTFSHTASTLILIWNGTCYNQKLSEWFGLRNFVMVVIDNCTAANCDTCQPDSTTLCSICNSEYYLYNGECQSSCPAVAYYPDSTTWTCNSCNTSCYSCSGSASNQCTACSSGEYLYNSECYVACPPATYPSGSTCQTCYTTCTTCSGGASNECTSCLGSYFLSGTTCVTACPTSTFADFGNNECIGCYSNCSACTSTAPNACTACISGNFLYASSCTTSCPATGYYPDFTNNICEACDQSCYTCTTSGTSSCTSCTGTSYLYQGTCSSTCPTTGYYPDSTNNTCEACDSTCYTCSSSGASSCTSCTGTSYLYQGACGSTCPTGYYPDSADNICEACDQTCYTCTTSGTSSCTSCTGTSYLYQGTCSSTCPTGYYPDSTNNICEACESTCYTCTTSGTSSCTSCTGTSYLYEGTCGSTCPTGYYPNSTNNTCDSCYSNCMQCTSSTTCTQCNPGYNLTFGTNNLCISCNSNGHYISGLQCLPCDNTCQTCSGSLATNCLTCPSRTYLLISNNSCVGTCSGNGYYISGSDCLQCDSSCLTCNGATPNNCISCPDSAYYLSSNQSCVVSGVATVQAAESVGTAFKVIFISAAVSAVITYLLSKGNSPTLMRMLQIMARITFMKLIDINYLTPLAEFYHETDLGQFGLPNFFNKMEDTTTTSSRRVLAQSSSSNSSSSFFVLNTQGDVTFNRYFGYSFGQVFLDNYGGIVFSSSIVFVLYIIVKIVAKCFKNENSKIKQFLIKIAQTFERSLIATILVSRYMYLSSSLIFNYVLHPLNGVYEQFSFGFAIFYTVLLVFIFGLAICAGFYQSRESKARLKPIRPILNILTLLLHQYRSVRIIGRIFTFWTLLSDLMIVLVLLLLYKWPVAQLIILIIVSLITIILSLPNSVFKKTASKILTIGTEVGFIIISILFLVMYFLQNIGTLIAYNILLIFSWSGVGVNISIILFQLIIEIFEFFRRRKEKKRLEQLQKTIQSLNHLENPSRLIEQSGNFNDPHNSQPIQISQVIQMPGVDETEIVARKPNKYEVDMVNRSRSRTRRTVNIDDANNSQVQLQNSHKRELSFEQPNRYKGNMVNANRKRKPNRSPDSSLSKSYHS